MFAPFPEASRPRLQAMRAPSTRSECLASWPFCSMRFCQPYRVERKAEAIADGLDVVVRTLEFDSAFP